jgi:molecular chaperone DnaJ
VSFVTAALGGSIEIPTCDGGRAKVNIPEGTQGGAHIRLRGKGMPMLRGGGMKGDLYVEIAVETPVRLTEHQRKLMKEFDESLKKGGGRHSPVEESWAEKLKGFFNA